VCLEVADVTRSMAALTPNGVRVLDPQPKIGAHGNPVGDTALNGCSCSWVRAAQPAGTVAWPRGLSQATV
jgi:hypothetical protein